MVKIGTILEDTSLGLIETARRKKNRFFAITNRDPKLAAGALFGRINRLEKEEKAASVSDAADRVDSMIEARPLVSVKLVSESIDRWCRACKEIRADDPCEVCARKTVVHGA